MGALNSDVREGLEGVVVTQTRLSHVDGERGQLIVTGYEIAELVAQHNFEAACATLWSQVGGESSAAVLRERLDAGRMQALASLPQLGDALQREDAMDALRAGLAHWPSHTSPEQLVAATAVYTAAHARLRAGIAPLTAADVLGATGHAGALLSMLGAETARKPAYVRALDAYLVTVLDHGLNASTFAARVVASTQSDPVSAVVAGVGALKGPLHGGAPGPVLAMLDAVSEPERARDFLEDHLRRGQRIMGMGHRIYRTRDPRAEVLEQALSNLERSLAQDAASDGSSARIRQRLALARAVEREAERLLAARSPERALKANVEFYTAVLLSALGIAPELFSAVFACARVAGWLAHYREQQRHGRLIRPASSYVGRLPESGLSL